MLPGLLVAAAGPQARRLTLPRLALTGNSRGATTEPVLQMRKQRSEGSSGTRGRDTAMLPRFCQLWGPGALAASRMSVSRSSPRLGSPEAVPGPVAGGGSGGSGLLMAGLLCPRAHCGRQDSPPVPRSLRPHRLWACTNTHLPGPLLCVLSPCPGPPAQWEGRPCC